jgi:hypothetical protein
LRHSGKVYKIPPTTIRSQARHKGNLTTRIKVVFNPGYAGIPGYEEYLKRQSADVGVADASLAARRATSRSGLPTRSSRSSERCSTRSAWR